MAGLFGAVPALSGLDSYLDPRRSQLLALAAGLSSSPDFGQAVSNGFAGAAQARPVDNAYIASKAADAERQAQINQTQQWIQKNFPQFGTLPPDQGFQLAAQMMSRAPKEPADPSSTATGRQKLAQQYGLTGVDAQTYVLTGKLPGGNQTSRAGVGQSLPYRNIKTGELVGVQPMTTGPAVNTITGLPLENPSDWVYAPGELAGAKTMGQADAKNAAAARAALPGAQQAFDIANKAADALLNDTAGMADQFGNTLGVPHQMMPDWATLPGSPMARFRTELAQGQGNAFLQARQVLKGAGQVTDYEGAKAEAAYSRMQLAAQKNNQEEFIAAVQDFKQAVNEGYQKLQDAAQGDYAAGGPGITATQPSGGNMTSTGIPWSYSP